MYRRYASRELFLTNLNEKRARWRGRSYSWRRRNRQRDIDFARKERRYDRRH